MRNIKEKKNKCKWREWEELRKLFKSIFRPYPIKQIKQTRSTCQMKLIRIKIVDSSRLSSFTLQWHLGGWEVPEENGHKEWGFVKKFYCDLMINDTSVESGHRDTSSLVLSTMTPTINQSNTRKSWTTGDCCANSQASLTFAMTLVSDIRGDSKHVTRSIDWSKMIDNCRHGVYRTLLLFPFSPCVIVGLEAAALPATGWRSLSAQLLPFLKVPKII